VSVFSVTIFGSRQEYTRVVGVKVDYLLLTPKRQHQEQTEKITKQLWGNSEPD